MSSFRLTARAVLVICTVAGASLSPLAASSSEQTTASPSKATKPPTMDKVDYHVHIKGELTPESTLQKSREVGIAYGVALNGGLSFPISNDAGLEPFLQVARKQGFAYVAFQAEGREWVTLFTRPALEKFDYIFTDSMTWTDDNGKRMRLWIKDEVGDDRRCAEVHGHAREARHERSSTRSRSTST